MRDISTALKEHMASGSTTLAHLVKMTRTDGEVLSVVLDHDRSITYDSVTYVPAFGMYPSSIETSSEMNVDNLDAKGALLAMGVNEADIVAGLWDLCDVRVIRVNYMDLTMGHENLKRGNFGEISLGRGSFNTEIRGITQKLQQTIGDVVSSSCNADLFDTRCGVAETVGTWVFNNKAITTATSQRQFTISSLAQAADFFTAGKVTFTTGANTGLSMEIKSHSTGGVIVLQEDMPYAISVGNEVTIKSGCRKRFAEDCVAKFNNGNRNRSFPFLPGEDQMYKGV